MYQVDVFCTSPSFFLPPADPFSSSRPQGTQGVRVYTRRKSGPRPISVARALGVQSREKWHVTTGSISDDLEPTRPIETRNNFRIFKEKEHRHTCICTVWSTPSHHHHHHQEKPPPLSPPARELAACCCCCCCCCCPSSFKYNSTTTSTTSSKL